MTGGRVVVLGPTGRNFAAGMSGGLAFVLDEDGAFRGKVNPAMLDQLEELDEGDTIEVRALVEEHRERTGSPVAERVLDDWESCCRASSRSSRPTTSACWPSGRRAERRRARRPRRRAARARHDGVGTPMGELGGFLKVERVGVPSRPDRAHGDYKEFVVQRPDEELREQGGRCMDCGVPSATTAARWAT